MTTLGLDPRELSTCVQCGLCLPHCPTFRVTGDESRSPRGRIALMRAVEAGDAPLSPEVRRSFETCVQCRGCETACPSGVPFGHLMAQTRSALVETGGAVGPLARAAYALLERPRLLRAASRGAAIVQRAGLVPRAAGLPRLAVRERPLRATGGDVLLFTGCVMDAWQRDVHRATATVLESAGFGVTPTGDRAPCCGALHEHAGLAPDARRLARRAVRELGGEAPVLANSAGCGAAMKEYGQLLGTAAATAFAGRVLDVSEFLAAHLERLPAVPPLDLRVAIQDPCHLRHAQRCHLATRDVLAPFVRELVELDDEGLCCGAGGAYALYERESARAIRARKVAAIARAAPDVVVSANPGCLMHLAAAGVPTAHPMTLVARALAGAGPAPATGDGGS
jgi:glycolate oxidase iron-sulfur subunit